MRPIEERVRDAERRLFARYDLAVTEHLVDLKVAGSELRVRVLETGSGTPVVLLHPATMSAAHWAPLLAQIPDRRLLCVDFPGHGLSDGVDFRKHDARAHTVAMLGQLLSELGLGPVPIVGNSLGGMAALWLAAAEPSLVSHLAILGVPAVAFPGASLNFGLGLMTIPGLNRLLMSLPSSPGTSRKLLKAPLGRAAWEQTPDEVFEIHYLASSRPEFALTLSTMLQSVTRWFAAMPHFVLTESELASLPQPVRLLWGDREIFGGLAVAERAVAAMQNAELEVHPGVHHLQLNDPEWCAKVISKFLADPN